MSHGSDTGKEEYQHEEVPGHNEIIRLHPGHCNKYYPIISATCFAAAYVAVTFLAKSESWRTIAWGLFFLFVGTGMLAMPF